MENTTTISTRTAPTSSKTTSTTNKHNGVGFIRRRRYVVPILLGMAVLWWVVVGVAFLLPRHRLRFLSFLKDYQVGLVQDPQSKSYANSFLPPNTVDGSNEDNRTNKTPQHHTTTNNGSNSIMTMKDKNGSFASCLLVMDDNFRLYEWIAYHWHVLPLRYLIVAMDPRSATSPRPVLDLFHQELGLDYQLWTDDDFNTNGALDGALWTNVSADEIRGFYLVRQRQFYKVCMEELQRQNQTWTTLHDVDEFIVVNGFERNVSVTFNESLIVQDKDEQGKKGSLSKWITSPSSMHAPGTVYSFLQRMNPHDMVHCYTFPRLLYGTEKDTTMNPQDHDRVGRTASLAGLDANQSYRLDTLRWNCHGRRDSEYNGLAKVMIDVTYLPEGFHVRNPHRPVLELCGGPFYGNTKDSPFLGIHYLGSWEMYTFRNDARKGMDKSREAWMVRSKEQCKSIVKPAEHDRFIAWLPGLVDSIGQPTAHMLLQHGGLPKDYVAFSQHQDNNSSGHEAEWKLKDEFEQKQQRQKQRPRRKQQN